MRPPVFEPRRRKELQEELLTRARAWLADWHPRGDGDFATALFKIAARIESEVTQRLNRAPEKAFSGFLDWLGVKGKSGLAARLPVVFTMTPGSDPVDAPARVQLQINSGETPVNFETEAALRILRDRSPLSWRPIRKGINSSWRRPVSSVSRRPRWCRPHGP